LNSIISATITIDSDISDITEEIENQMVQKIATELQVSEDAIILKFSTGSTIVFIKIRLDTSYGEQEKEDRLMKLNYFLSDSQKATTFLSTPSFDAKVISINNLPEIYYPMPPSPTMPPLATPRSFNSQNFNFTYNGKTLSNMNEVIHLASHKKNTVFIQNLPSYYDIGLMWTSKQEKNDEVGDTCIPMIKQLNERYSFILFRNGIYTVCLINGDIFEHTPLRIMIDTDDRWIYTLSISIGITAFVGCFIALVIYLRIYRRPKIQISKTEQSLEYIFDETEYRKRFGHLKLQKFDHITVKTNHLKPKRYTEYIPKERDFSKTPSYNGNIGSHYL
jgi:hypothetical protein